MKRALVYIVSLSMIMALGCERPTPSEGADDEAETSVESLESEQEAAQIDGDGQFDLTFGVGHMLVATVSPVNSINEIVCQCRPDELGHQTTESCLQYETKTEAELAEASACIQGYAEAIPGDQPAQGQATIECLLAPLQPVEECVADLRADQEELCSEESMAATQRCAQMLREAVQEQDACEQQANEETDRWMRQAVQDDCLAIVGELLMAMMR